MHLKYIRNEKIVIYGSQKDIVAAEAIIDTIDGLEAQLIGDRLVNEGAVRLKLQNALDVYGVKATILVDGNTVYPFAKIVKQYEMLKLRGTLEKMSNEFYEFLSINFDIAHYNKSGYIETYNNDFATLKREIIDKATTSGRYTDVQRILDHIQGRATSYSNAE